ncbi:hypothetical protein FKW77_005659 [Venturia effusa]|uniref:Uncharacterized protein n=1 Tax=Venturia effusa TaxID=50376 RepID=A0A517LP09_9PEZI|nr:hypothetical protein FKW77_005659 [Venturia effusa]
MMYNAVSLIAIASTALPALAAVTSGVGIHNRCDFPVYINDVAPAVNQYERWTSIAPSADKNADATYYQAQNPPAAGGAGITLKLGLERSANIMQLGVAVGNDNRFYYTMSNVDGNPFFAVSRRVGCFPNYKNFDSTYCGPSQTTDGCATGNPGRVMSAPTNCGAIVLELCAEA